MPYDDSDVKKMIRNQIDKKVSFSRRVQLSDSVKHLIHAILEVNVTNRLTTDHITKHPWMTSPSPPPSAATSAVDTLVHTNASTSPKQRQSTKSELPHSSVGHREPAHTGHGSLAVGVNEPKSKAAAGGTSAGMKTHTDLSVAATTGVDGLSHNNSARGGQEEAPKPLDKTKKTTQLNTITATDLDDSLSMLRELVFDDDRDEGW